jgi:hypothetical protein
MSKKKFRFVFNLAVVAGLVLLAVMITQLAK